MSVTAGNAEVMHVQQRRTVVWSGLSFEWQIRAESIFTNILQKQYLELLSSKSQFSNNFKWNFDNVDLRGRISSHLFSFRFVWPLWTKGCFLSFYFDLFWTIKQDACSAVRLILLSCICFCPAVIFLFESSLLLSGRFAKDLCEKSYLVGYNVTDGGIILQLWVSRLRADHQAFISALSRETQSCERILASVTL